MSKVNKSKGRQAGTASVATKDQKSLEGKKIILAEREGYTRKFSKLLWDNLPPDKAGWKESSEKPTDIPVVKDDNDNLAGQVEFQKALLAYTTLFGQDPSDGMSTEDLNEAVAKKIESDNAGMVDHIVTQDDLDLNAELATSGVKVGDTIKIKSEGGNP